jgi:hypothetical protein
MAQTETTSEELKVGGSLSEIMPDPESEQDHPNENRIDEDNPQPLEEDQPVPAPDTGTDNKKEAENVLEVLESKTEPVDVTLEYNGATATYTQKPLTYFRKMEFFSLVGETLDEAMEGENGLTVNSLLGGDIGATDFSDLDSFMALVAKIAHYVPNFLKDAYIVILNIPKAERKWAREALDNLNDEEGLDIAERFVDQNWESINSFFRERLPALIQKVQDKQKS